MTETKSETKSTYFRIRLQQVPEHLEEEVTEHSFACGASGVAEALTFSQPDLTYDADIINKAYMEFDVFFPEEPARNFYQGLGSLNPNIHWSVHEEQHKDWLEEWKKGFEAFQLVGPYWIVPSWLETPTQAEKSLLIDPGMAFGTGTHATTRMAASFLFKLTEKFKSETPNWAMIDVGTGTAILAMLAARQGMGIITGIEIDPEARRVARENTVRNNLNQVEISNKLIEEIRDQYDVVVANIIDGVLLNIKNDLLRVLRPGGYLFLTGILQERDDMFFNKFIENSGLEVVRRLEDDEWVGYWLRAPQG